MRVGSVLALHEKTVELARPAPVERGQLRACQRAGDEVASPTPADGSDAANLPRALDEGGARVDEGSSGASEDSSEVDEEEETGQYTTLTRRALMAVADS